SAAWAVPMRRPSRPAARPRPRRELRIASCAEFYLSLAPMPSPAPSFHPSPSRPRLRLPKGACDSHVHVFGPSARFPYAKDAPFIPHDAPKEELFRMHAHVGIERCCIVQSSCHRFDNRATEDAIHAKGGAYCGVALLPTDVDDRELKRLDAAGFRGVRFNFM